MNSRACSELPRIHASCCYTNWSSPKDLSNSISRIGGSKETQFETSSSVVESACWKQGHLRSVGRKERKERRFNSAEVEALAVLVSRQKCHSLPR